MWSDRYYYWNICKDINLSGNVSTGELITFLESLPEFRKVSQNYFRNTTDFPFVELSVLYTGSIDSWSASDFSSNKANLMAIVCEKGIPENFDRIIELMIKIATFANWIIIDEESEDGIENQIIWPGNFTGVTIF